MKPKTTSYNETNPVLKLASEAGFSGQARSYRKGWALAQQLFDERSVLSAARYQRENTPGQAGSSAF